MVNTDFAIFKYRTENVLQFSTPVKVALLALGVLAGVFWLLDWFVPMLLLVVPALVIYWKMNRGIGLCIGPRYLICGRKIIYYRNVVRVEHVPASHLSLVSNTGQELQIVMSSFPSNARKADKIRRHQAAKFAKASEKILQKLAMQAPGVV